MNVGKSLKKSGKKQLEKRSKSAVVLPCESSYVPSHQQLSSAKTASAETGSSTDSPNTLGWFYEWILNSTIIFAACAFFISLFGYHTADDPIAEQINMGTLLISGAIVGLLTAVRWLMGAMSTHLSNQAKIIELMSKKDGDE